MRASFGVAAAVVPPDELDEHALAVGEPWPRLMRLTGPAAPNKKTALTAEEIAIVEADAAACLARMRRLKGEHGATIVSMFASDIEPAYVAAALGVLCGHFRHLTGRPNYSAAAMAFGKAPELAAKAKLQGRSWSGKWS